MKKNIKNKKGQALTGIIILGVIVIAIILASGSIRNPISSITGTGNYIEHPVFKYVKCEAISDLKYSQPTILATNGQWLPKPSVASSYNVIINSGALYLNLEGLITTNGVRVVYSVCNSEVLSQSNCRLYGQSFLSGTSNTISNVKSNEYVWAQYQYMTPLTLFKWKENSGAKYQIGYVPYGLRVYDVLSGSSSPLNPNDCSIPTNDDSWKDRVLGSDSSKVNQQVSKSVNQNTLMPEEIRWYLTGYLTSAAPSFMLNYNGQNAWCRTTGTSAEVYKINTISLASGTYQIASSDWSDYLGNVNCCPNQVQGDKICSSSYQWVQIAGTQCGAFKSCGAADWTPYSSQQVIKYYCDNGYCKSQTKAVECANDYDCKDANKVCDLNSFICVQANVNLNGQVIKTIPDSKEACDKEGGRWITQTTEQGNLLTLLGITKPKVIVTEYCEMKGWNWVLIVGVAIAIVLIVIFHKKILAILRMILHRIGIKI